MRQVTRIHTILTSVGVVAFFEVDRHRPSFGGQWPFRGCFRGLLADRFSGRGPGETERGPARIGRLIEEAIGLAMLNSRGDYRAWASKRIETEVESDLETLLASRLPGLLPALEHHEALETAALASLSRGGFTPARWQQRPFRAPHHSASAAALVGGGSDPRPGEISLAHHGVLFLDELPEFRRDALEVLREPMETGTITLSRAARQAEYPARFQLVAAMNPCPCGYCGDPDGDCRCTPEQIQRYRARISGPLLDRIDLQVQMPRIPWEQLHSAAAEDSATVRQRVVAARRHQQARGFLNARLPLNRLESVCVLGAPQQLLLHKAATRFRLSPRSIHRIIRMARTIADLDQAARIGARHLQEAIGYRCLDRQARPGH